MRYREQKDDELERMRSRGGRTPSRRTYYEEAEDSYDNQYEDGYEDEYENEYEDDSFDEDDLEAVYIEERPGRAAGSRRRTAPARAARPRTPGNSGNAASGGPQPYGGGGNSRRRGKDTPPEAVRPGRQPRRKKKRRLRLVRNVLLLILAAWLGSTAWAFFHKQTGTWTIAIFGVDSRDGSLEKNALADVQMICTVDRATGEIRLASIYRDTYLKINSKGTYHKINEAYFKGGHKQAVSALEENLDLKIDNYATFNWKAVADGINILGGVDIDITKPEFKYINAFITETVNSTGIGSYQLESAGMNHLDGVQAVAYCRLRLMDTDYQRTERQRKVVSLALDKAKQADVKTLTSLVMTVLPQLSTDIGVNDVLPMAKDIKKYHLGETGGFPFSRQSKKIGRMDCVIPTTLESNVVQLHQFLYGAETYKAPSGVKKISQKISEDSGLYGEGQPAPNGGGGQSSGQTKVPVRTESQTAAPSESAEPEVTAEETTAEETTEETGETGETEPQEIGPGITPVTQAEETTKGADSSNGPGVSAGPGSSSPEGSTESHEPPAAPAGENAPATVG